MHGLEPAFSHPLPFLPEPVARLRARLKGATEELLDPAEIALDPARRPGQNRRHVMDFHDGTRLIISRERPDGIHLSASVNTRSVAFLNLAEVANQIGLDAAADGLRMLGEAHYRELAGPDAALRFQFFTEGAGVPHWFAPDPEPESESEGDHHEDR
jgi:hypothetical protein